MRGAPSSSPDRVARVTEGERFGPTCRLRRTAVVRRAATETRVLALILALVRVAGRATTKVPKAGRRDGCSCTRRVTTAGGRGARMAAGRQGRGAGRHLPEFLLSSPATTATCRCRPTTQPDAAGGRRQYSQGSSRLLC